MERSRLSWLVLRLRFVLDVGFAFVEASEKEEKEPRYNHDCDKVEKVFGAFEVFSNEVYEGCEKIAERNPQKISAHHQRLEFFWRLCICEFKVGNGDHYLRGRQSGEGYNLPDDMRRLAGIDAYLNPGNNGEGQSRNE